MMCTQCQLLILQPEIRDQFAGRVVDECAPAEQAESVVEADHDHLNERNGGVGAVGGWKHHIRGKMTKKHIWHL